MNQSDALKQIELQHCGKLYDYLVFAKGHHRFDHFCTKLRQEGYYDQANECPIDRDFLPRHGYARIMPDSTGEHNFIMTFTRAGRGAFPITYVEP